MRFTWVPYSDAFKAKWNWFALKSDDCCFLFQRDYLEYHSDRFVDASLVCMDGTGEMIAILPANTADGSMHSHQGLTFGGVCWTSDSTLQSKLECFDSLLSYLKSRDFRQLTLKTLPSVFKNRPNADIEFILTRAGAELFRRDLSCYVSPYQDFAPQERRKRGAKKALKAGLIIESSDDFESYWSNVLEPVLAERHGVKPTHSRDEIRLLRDRFTDQMSLLVGRLHGAIVSGTVLYRYPNCIHAQYIGANEAGKSINALDAVFMHAIEQARLERKFFSFGISSEKLGRVVNTGLLEWKMGFAATTLTHDHYVIDLNKPLNSLAAGQ